MFEAFALFSPFVTAGASVGATAIKTDAAKKIAQTEYKSALTTLLAQERLLTARAELDAETQRLADAQQAKTQQTVVTWAAVALIAVLVLGDR